MFIIVLVGSFGVGVWGKEMQMLRRLLLFSFVCLDRGEG